ncbi:MAG: hypothetical protein ACRBFS_09965 [Aureispira sp.]
MFKWLRRWKRYSIAEISNHQHLEQARMKEAAAFIAVQAPLSSINWPILILVEGVVYWGKEKEGLVQQQHFYKTDKKGIEAAFLGLSPASQKNWKTHLKGILSAYFDRFDGQLVRLKEGTILTIEITEKGHYKVHYDLQVEAQSTGLHAPVEEQTRRFELLLSGRTFEELALKELR